MVPESSRYKIGDISCEAGGYHSGVAQMSSVVVCRVVG